MMCIPVPGISCGRLACPTEHRRATQMTARDGKDYDYLIGMDRWNLQNMKGILREEDWGKVSMLLHFCGEDREVADPLVYRGF